ncbi:hypothetical protein [Pseudonocardia aurantiaca]|uniref:Uncharacterized protein n=1 Tax=Pseudonocardia aurantiaca TaxID=75290 RepID=A0ABW4FM40_9PSEU
MQCVQDTIERRPQFTALEWEGLAPDTAVAALPSLVACRLTIEVGDRAHRCCDPAAVALVSVARTDPSLPGRARAALRELVPGGAIAGSALGELVGGWIAMPGVDIRVTGSADLGDGGAVAITLADAAVLLQAAGGDRLLVRTIAVLAEPSSRAEDAVRASDGWRVVADGVASVPLRPGVVHDHPAGWAA